MNSSVAVMGSTPTLAEDEIAHIGEMARFDPAGLSNRDVAAQLFVSPRRELTATFL